MAEMTNYVVARFVGVLMNWAERFAAQSGLPSFSIALPNDFHEDEANGFLRALDAQILKVNDIGRFSLPSIHRSGTKPTEPCLFGVKKENVVYLAWREYVTQVGALASLVLEYGWPTKYVALDPRNWEFDVAGFASESANAFMIVAGETKKTEKELSKLLSQLLAASKSSLTLEQLGSSDGHKKFRGLLKERSPYFWAVAPGARKAFTVKYEGNSAIVEETADLPAYSEIRFSV
jgi:hypothetical protein